jgi:hypothetical protein
VQVFWGVEGAAAEVTRLKALRAEVHEPFKDVGGDIKVASVRDLFGNLFNMIENRTSSSAMYASLGEDSAGPGRGGPAQPTEPDR